MEPIWEVMGGLYKRGVGFQQGDGGYILSLGKILTLQYWALGWGEKGDICRGRGPNFWGRYLLLGAKVSSRGGGIFKESKYF